MIVQVKWKRIWTCSTAFAEAAQCFVSVSSTIASVVQYIERNLLLLVTSASGLPLRANKLCSVLFCSSWSSVLVVINKDSLMRGDLCGKRTVDGRSCCSHSTSYRSIATYSSIIAIFADPTCIRRPRYGGPRRNIAITYNRCGSSRMVWLSDGENNFKDMFIRFDRAHERDTQTDRQTDRQRMTA